MGLWVFYAQSEDGYHHATSYASSRDDGYYRCICTYCGKEFTAYASDLEQSYEKQVANIQSAFGTTEFGVSGFILPLPVIDFEEEGKVNVIYFSAGYSFSVSFTGSRAGSGNNLYLLTDSSLIGPVSGSYTLGFEYSGSNARLYNEDIVFALDYLAGEHFVFRYDRPCLDVALSKDNSTSSKVVMQGRFYFLVKPFSYDINDYMGGMGGITTRPTSITGNYGIIGDNGQITQVTDNSSIVNETTNQFFNPATGESATISDWTYNYEDRSYTVTTESGDTVTVTYGDENITIVQGGDTYNIYYMVPGGSGTPGPDTCTHNWQETDKTEPTCVTAGKTVSTCSLCGKTKTDPLPATGHTWVVERTVQTSYDDEGNLLQQGYTIYQCSVCGEQYKDTQSTGPPGGTEEDKSLWEQLGDLISSGIGGILELAGAILGKILDALTSLVEMITDKLKGIVEGILAIFDELPALFGGFLDFLGALFPYLPEEIMTLLTFGVIAIVFIGILKAVRR